MTISDEVVRFFLQAHSGPLRECRLCGTTLDEDGQVCPECGSDEIAEYEFE